MAFRIIITKALFFPKSIPFQNPNFSSTTCNNSHPISTLLQQYGFPIHNLHNFLKSNQFLLNSNVTDIETSLKILSLFNSSTNFITSTVSNCPRVLDLNFLKKWELGISKLGVLDNMTMIQKVLEVSRKFDLYPDDVLQCIECLKGFRFSSVTITRVLEEFPMVITMSEEQIWGKVEFLLGIGIHRSKIDSVIRMYPGVLGFGVENKLKPLIGEFSEMGFEPKEIRDEIVRNPKILRSEVGELSKCLRMLNSLKCRVPVKEKIFSDGAFRASYNVKLRIDCLHKHGLSYRDAFSVLWREPRVVLYDLDEIDKKIEFLINVMKFDVYCLVDVPEYLGVHFEKQIVPRYNVIEYLRSKGGIGDEVGLRSLVKFSRLRFYNLYVKPYPECEKIYGRFVDVKVRHGHPEGLWKLFKPPKYSDSKEDLKNIRSFMEQLH
ncbi:putative transcription regulator mTERF family [Helianthus annuus]|uniref:Transcription regulator mTERF family n=1 Tax=Helianthus annuus TaxID=4232 RepID=A0A9K3J2S7_HELAN|nr:transcription termination factor MTERF15, mitochondrial [Helianthus annuus]KAF5807297.1 putative transcription regulator mTERF family [Helianthus annuus]KAJ0585806.1 putative transcription regulator mTERF family [Helianthus annuus]KAJ0920439.1 putative transcription regulator mTERF family [Helianthus annuus]KAJ0924050.1 putative transcription regulator mTERF family [Helianthus annuus]